MRIPCLASSSPESVGAEPERDGSGGCSRLHKTGLVVVMLTAIILRLGGISEVGIRYDDSGAYASDARLWYRCASVLVDGEAIGAVLRGDKKALQARMDTIGVDFGDRYNKPCQGYTFLCAAMMLFVGESPTALLVTNGLCGILAVLVLYRLGSEMLGREIGLLAAAFLAVSPFHIVYCRSGLADSTAILFILLGMLAWTRKFSGRWSVRKSYLLCGIAFGMSICCHYRSAYIPPTLVLADLVVLVHARFSDSRFKLSVSAILRSWMWLTLGVAIPILAMESLFLTARLAAWVSDAFLPLSTFVEAMWERVVILRGIVSVHGESALNPRAVSAYTDYFVHWHGLIASILGAFGLVLLLCGKGAKKGPAVLALTLLAVLLFQRFVVARAASVVVPFFCLGMATAVYWLVGKTVSNRGRRRGAVWALLVIAGTHSCQLAVELYGKRSGVASACTYLERQGEGTVVLPLESWVRPKYSLYLDAPQLTTVRGQYHKIDTPQAMLEKFRADGVRWMIIDPQYWHWRDPAYPGAEKTFWWWEEMGEELERNAVLVAEFSHLSDYRWEFLAEGPGLQDLQDMVKRNGGSIRIYDIESHGVRAGAKSSEDEKTVQSKDETELKPRA